MTSELLQIFSQSAGIFVALFLGIWLRSSGHLPKNSIEVLEFLIFKIIVPFLIFDILYGLSFSASDSWLLASLLGYQLLLLGLGFGLSSLLSHSKKKTGAVMLSLICFSVGVVGYPFTELNFSNDVFQRVVLMDISMLILVFVLGPLVGAWLDQRSKFQPAAALKAIATEPILLIAVGTLLLNQLPIELPLAVTATSGFVASGYAFLVVLYTGAILKLPNLAQSLEAVSWYAVRLVLVGGIFGLLQTTRLGFEISNLNQTALVLTTIAPFSSFILYYANKYHLDSQLVARLSVVSILVSFVIYPVVISLM